MVPLKLWVFLYLCLQIYTMSSLMSRQLFWQWYIKNFFNHNFIIFFNHFIHFTRLRLCQRHVNRWHTGRETFWINTKNKQKKLKWYCHDVKNKRGCSSNPRVFVFLMARPQRSSPLQLRPCWYYWSKAIQTHMMPSGVNVNNRINIVLLHVNMFCSFV